MENINADLEELIDRLRNGETFKDIIKRVPKYTGYVGERIISYITTPFETVIFHKMFHSSVFVKHLRNEVTNMEYYRKTSDLYNFEQSMDFQGQVDLGKFTRLFMEIMHVKLKQLVENMYKFKCSHISITASRYKQKDYLLCHDDKCSDRHIAFIYYLCPDWKKSDGGLLCLYSHDKGTKEPVGVVKTIVPQMNDFLVFKVGTTTYHEVSEVTAENNVRYTINGWFHSPVALKEQPTHQLFNPIDPLLIVDSSNKAVKFANYFTPLYFRQTIVTEICEEYNKQNSVLLPNFLEQNFFNQCINELTDPILKWKWIGPSNQRRYEVATFIDDPSQKAPENIGKLLKCLIAPNFFDYMECLTGERLSGEEVSVNGRVYVLQLQRWSEGCYSLLSDNNIQTGFDMLDLNLFLKVDYGSGKDCLQLKEEQGSVAYLLDNVNIIAAPSCNSLFVVNNKENMGRYVKYINRLANKKAYIYIIYMTCLCTKNTPSTSVSTSVEKMLSSSDSISVNKTEHANEGQLDSWTRKMNRKKQYAKAKHKGIIKENITFEDANCKDRKCFTLKNICKNTFLVSENGKMVEQTIQNNLSGKKISNGNTFIVTENLDVPKKKIKEENSTVESAIACHH